MYLRHHCFRSLDLPKHISSTACQKCRTFATAIQHFMNYDDTIPNLKIGKHTRIIYQGFTGKVSTSNAQQSIAWGTNIVGGTTPGREGTHLNLPLLPTVRAAAEQLKPDATAVFVSAQHAARAIEDAIEAEIPLIVAVAEFVPLHDMLRIMSILNTQSKSRLVGANSPGIISPLHRCRIGFQPLSCYMPGSVGLVAKSGTLSYETVASLTRAGLGQSLCIGMGGDIVAGTDMLDALQVFEHDDDTEAIVLVGEVGGRAELDAADWIRDYRRRTAEPKPIVGLVAGSTAPPGRIMGHAGAFVGLGEYTADYKAGALANAGITMVEHPSGFGGVVKRLLGQSDTKHDAVHTAVPPESRRGHHTMSRGYPLPFLVQRPKHINNKEQIQKRSLYLSDRQSKAILSASNIRTADSESLIPNKDSRYVAIKIDRTRRCPAILSSPTTSPKSFHRKSRIFPYDYATGPDEETVDAVLRHIKLNAAPPVAQEAAVNLLQTLADLFKSKEAYALETFVLPTADGSLAVEKALFAFDDSAYKIGNRHADIHSQRDTTGVDPDELSVEEDGIVYIKLKDPTASIGTLVNGAGLAMNALDAMTYLDARPTNFLDTGGKATAETVKKSFEVILKDPRVKVIFVNIFGGLTLCDMIAEGIILAFKELDMGIPVVVRLRGTNEEMGQKMIQDSGLPLHVFDDFFEAVKKCRELAATQIESK